MTCPEWLDDVAKEEWSRVTPLLVDVTPTDQMLLAAYCQTYSQWRKCEETVAANGLTYVTNSGEEKLHPAARHSSTLLAELRRIAGEFGLTPRTRSKAAGQKDDDELASYEVGNGGN